MHFVVFPTTGLKILYFGALEVYLETQKSCKCHI